MKNMNPDSSLMPKIDIMAAVANGTQIGVQDLEKNLNEYVATYPKEEPTPLAREILTLIADSALTDYQKLIDMGYISEEIVNEELMEDNLAADDEFGGKYSYEEDLLHYFVIAYPREDKIDLNRLNFDIANYNIDHYTKIDFDIESEVFDDKLSFVIVRALENKESALIYHGAIIRNASVYRELKDIDFLNFVISSTNYRAVLNEQSLSDYLKFFVKNYSRYIRPNFSEEEPEVSPEELMARAKEQDNILKEKGKFVVVDTGADKLFNTDVDTAQNFVLAIKDKNLSTRQILNDFSQFNKNEFRLWNLALQLKESGEYRLMVVNGIPTLNESMSYFRKVVVTRSLFQSLGQTTYRNFLITSENLEKLVEQNNVDEYMNFFRINYIQRATQPASTTSQAAGTSTTQASGQATVATENQNSGEYIGPYDNKIEGEQYFVFVIPVLGIDQPAFISGIEQFNTASYSNLNLKVDLKQIDEVRQVVRISGLPDLETARLYFTKVVNNRDLYVPLRNATYRNFLVTETNYNIFLEEKNIVEYMDFYKKFYLGQ
jgi:hypothetical protein